MKLTDSTKGLHVSVYLKFQTSETLLISVTGSQSQNHIWGAKNAKKRVFFVFFFIYLNAYSFIYYCITRTISGLSELCIRN